MNETKNLESGECAAPAGEERQEPSVYFRSIVFSDGTRIDLEPKDVVVFVGPNNAGKSLALRELDTMVRQGFSGKVVSSAEIAKHGTLEDLIEYIRQHSTEHYRNGAEKQYRGYSIQVYESNIEGCWNNVRGISDLSGFFCMRLETQDRISSSNPAPSFKALDEPASNAIQLLYKYDGLEEKISKYFRRAFGEDLIPFRLGGTEIPLLVGERFKPDPGEDRISESFCRRLRNSTIPLADQGDGMRSFASVILRLMAPLTPSILMLDEPEAFLHPPQAKLLGELIAKERSSRAQLFVATHSPDVLGGLLNVAPERLRILRVHREGDVNHVRELDKEQARAIGRDPLMKFSSVLSGVFHQRVILCESDADCLFYSSILDLPEINDGENPDVLFVHANGKHRIKKLARTLVDLGVKVDIVVDLDILKEKDDVRVLFETLNGHWQAISKEEKIIRCNVEQHKPWLNSRDISREIGKILRNTDVDGRFANEHSTAIQRLLRSASPWDVIKEAGESGFPAGDASESFGLLKAECKKVGLWIVPVGELEGFCKSVGGHGPRWVQQVFEQHDLSGSPQLAAARSFVKEIWSGAHD